MTKRIHPSIPLILVVFLLAACGQPATQPSKTPVTSGQLEGTRWSLLSYISGSGSLSAVVPGSQVTAEFNSGQVGGSAGCNSYSGLYEADGSSLSVGQLVSTLMACEEPLMQQESAFLAALGKTASYQIVEGQLSLLDAQGAVILIFSADIPAVSAPELPGDQSKLLGIVWKWVETIEPSGNWVTPNNPALYTLQFDHDGNLKIKADCNLGTGSYTLDGNLLTIHVGITTLALCADGSLTTEFIQYLNKAGSFFFQDGALYIEEIYDGGTLKFIQ